LPSDSSKCPGAAMDREVSVGYSCPGISPVRIRICSADEKRSTE